MRYYEKTVGKSHEKAACLLTVSLIAIEAAACGGKNITEKALETTATDVKESISEDKDSEEEMKAEVSQVYYDEFGQELRYLLVSRTDEEGEAEVYEYEFNSEGSPAKQAAYDAEGEVLEYTEYTYDDKGKLTKTVYYDGDGLDTIKTYDSDGNMMTQERYNTKEEYLFRFEYDYDENGFQSGYHYYYYNIGLKRVAVYTNDESGNLLSVVFSDAEGTITSSSEYGYDNDGKKILYTVYDSEGSAESYKEYEYNSYGELIKETSYEENELVHWYEYEYDGNGNLIREVYYNKSGEIGFSYDYEYMTPEEYVKF